MRNIIALLTFTLLASSVTAQDTTMVDSVITIGIKQASPFVELREGYAPNGLSLEFWSEVEGEAQVLYEFEIFDDLTTMISVLQDDKIDMSINPVTVTEERLKVLDFSQPFYISGTTLVRRDTGSWLAVVQNLFSWRFFSAVAILLLVIFIFGVLIWFFERRKNQEQFKGGLEGLADGFWWSAVTMTTVGYGDKAPITKGGRVIGFIWMFAAIIMISSLTAGIASSLTVQSLEANIESVEDLRRFDVGTISNSSSGGYLEIFNVDFDGFTSVEEGLKAVEEGDIDVFVYDRPILKYYLNHGEYEDLALSAQDLKTDYYSFSYPKGSELRDFLDPYVVKALKSERWNYKLKDQAQGAD